MQGISGKIGPQGTKCTRRSKSRKENQKINVLPAKKTAGPEGEGKTEKKGEHGV